MKVPESEFVKNVTLRICGSLDIERALRNTFEYIERYIPVDAMGLLYTDAKQTKLCLTAWIERENFRFFGLDTGPEILFDEEYSKLQKKYPDPKTGVRIFNHPDNLHPVVLRFLPKLKSCSIMNLFLNIDDVALGRLTIVAEGFNRYSRYHEKLMESVREPITIAMHNARRHMEVVLKNALLTEDMQAMSTDMRHAKGVEVIGADAGLKMVMGQVLQIANTSSPALLLGETGTGKEVIANAIHVASNRREGPMITMQCGAVPDSLISSELFGHEKGAFTGASALKRGRFERADGGTLFLDEIGELSPEAQVKLLRVLQENQFERLGGTKTIAVDVRVIAATHRNIEKMIQDGKFREDLWYRLNVFPIRIPPLRLRREDIPALAQYFLERQSREMNLSFLPKIDEDALENLKTYHWPGNVRELQNYLERSLISSSDGCLRLPEIDTSTEGLSAQHPPHISASVLTMNQVMKNHIGSVLQRTDGRINGAGGAAELLQMHPNTLRYRMKQLGMWKKGRYVQ